MYSSDMMAQSVADATMNSAPMMGLFFGIVIFSIVLGLISIISNWKIFNKAGKPGWASIVPIYNYIVMIQIAKLSLIYLLLLIIPVVNIFAIFKINIAIAKKFGKTTGFGIGMTLFSIIFIPLLAFSDNSYEDNKVESTTENNLTDNITNPTNNNNINNISVETDNSEIKQAPIMNSEQNITSEQPIENNNSNIEPENLEEPVVNAESVVNIELNNIPPITETNAFNSKPIETEPQLETYSSINTAQETNDISNSNIQKPFFEENVNNNQEIQIENIKINNTMQIPEIKPQEITEIPVINPEAAGEQKKVCKTCGESLPKIVSICPKCGTDNE